MPDEKNRFDIDLDFNAASTDILKDVEAASNAVKQRRTDEKNKEARTAQRSKSNKTSAILIAVGTLAIFLLSYWIVFAKPESDPTTATANGNIQCQQAQPIKIAMPIPTKPTTNTPQASVPTGTVGQDSQVVVHPPDGYEQPSEDPGM